MSQLVEDCLRIIFIELRNDPKSLYSCILINRHWCRIAIPILWKNPYVHKNISHKKLYNTIFNLLPTDSKQILLDDNIETSNKPLFNYISFSSQISPKFINHMVRTLIKDRISFGKYNKLEQEIYKLFVNNCKDIKDFLWKTTQSLSQYSGASTCFSRLSSLGIDLEFVNSTALFGMAQICQNIEDLKIWFYYGNISGLIMFLDNQKNLRSLYLYFKGSEKQCIELSEVIEKKADTLKELSIKPNITLISPKFLPSLINLQYLELYNKIELEEEIVEMEEWENYLSISTFPNLQYIKTLFLPICSDYKLIEKSHENILEIKIYRRYEDQDSIYTEKLIKAIANHCPKIERLTINAELKNLNGIKEILLNCSRLKRIDLSAYNEKRLNCDELLEVLVNFSSNTLYIFSFIDNWNFSVNSLKSFFENWKDKHPIIFIESFDEGDWFLEHKMIVKKYIDEGVIKKTNCLLMM